MVSKTFQLVDRRHLADGVFEQLSSAIIKGELSAGETLPSERILSERFGTSRILVRQAVHRLEELGLVRCRQGGSTEVMDVKHSGDPRVIALLYQEPGPYDFEGVRDIIEKQTWQGLAIVEVASRRASHPTLVAQNALALTVDPNTSLDAFAEFEERYWTDLASAGGNRILMAELAWWYRNISLHVRTLAASQSPMHLRVALYQELSRRLMNKQSPAEYYLNAMNVWLQALPTLVPSATSLVKLSSTAANVSRKNL